MPPIAHSEHDGRFSVEASVSPHRVHRHRYFGIGVNGPSREISAAIPNGWSWPISDLQV